MNSISSPISSDASLGRSYRIVVGLVCVLVVFCHWRIALAWPMAGIYQALALLLALLLAGLLSARGRVSLAGTGFPASLFLAFVGWSTWRTLGSDYPPDGLFSLGTFIQGVVWFFLGVFVVRAATLCEGGRKVSGLWMLVNLFALLAVVHAAHALVQYYFVFPAQLAEMRGSGLADARDFYSEGITHALSIRRVGSTFGNPNVLCGFLGMAFPLFGVCASGWLKRLEGVRHRRLVWVVIVVMFHVYFIGALRTESAGGSLVTIVGIALTLMILARDKTNKKWAVIRVIIGVLAALRIVLFHFAHASETPPGTPVAIEQTEDKEGEIRQIATIQQRIYYFQTGLRVWKRSPLMGNGLGSYERFYLLDRMEGAGETRHAHNFVIQLLAETGVVGLALFLGFLCAVFGRLMAVFRGPDSKFVLGVAAALLLFLLDSLGDYLFYVREVFGDFCLLAGALVAMMPAKERRGSIALAWGSGVVALVVATVAFWPVQVKPLKARDYARLARELVGEVSRLRSEPPTEQNQEEVARLLFDARGIANRALEWDDKNGSAWMQLAYIHSLSGNSPRVEATLKKAMERIPYSAAIHQQLADHYWAEGRREEAMAEIDHAIKLYPLNSEHYVRRAQFLLDSGRRPEALEASHRAEELAFSELEKMAVAELFKTIEADK